VQYGRRLTLCHYWVAFAAFLPAVLLGAWQMLIRSPLPAPVDDPGAYYASVTLHGTIMAYVLTTFFTMGFGYAVTATTLGRPIRGVTAAWVGFVICLIGTVMAAVPVIAGKASVLYTFYPPLLASAWYYGGVFLLIGGSMIWVVLMVVNMIAWKRDNSGKPVPLAMFAITATALLWAWAASGVLLELIGILLPRAFGWTDLIDSGLGRTLFSVTLHAIVYFWLMPAYVAFYTLLPQAAGGRLYSDTMGRLTFIMFLVFSLPVGMHHLLADPEHGSGFKFLQSFLTFLVALPTLLTVFSITASLEIAGRHRGGRGLLGWIGALPWEEPMVLAVGLSLVMLGLGGFGGLINMSYAMNSMIHNTSWVTAHFHLIFGGAVVIMYFAIAYEMWPRITGKPLRSKTAARWQLWLWFWGMLITTIPWHIAGLMGQPRRVAIPRSGQNPKILGRDNTEVIRYLITIGVPFSGHLLAQER
jgi:cytochrome c oxidase subunit I